MRLLFSSDSENVNKEIYWFVELSNGKCIYEDTIPNEESTWRRLHKYLSIEENVKILKLCLKFGQQIVTLDQDENFDGFFFSKREKILVGICGWTYYAIGRTKGNKAYVTWYGNGPKNQTNDILDCIDNDIRVIRYSTNEVSINNNSRSSA